MEECNVWEAGRFGNNLGLLRQTQAVMRNTYLYAMGKLQHLEEIQYLLSRLHTAGVAERCLAQFDEGIAAGAKHDPVSLEFIEVGSALRAAIEAIRGGAEMSSDLRAAWESLRQCTNRGCRRRGAPCTAAP